MTTLAEQMVDGAIDYLHEHGWTRGALEDNIGRVCLLGALAHGRLKVVISLGRFTKRRQRQVEWAWLDMNRAVLQVIERRSDAVQIEQWNDVFAKNADEVIEVLKLAKEEPV